MSRPITLAEVREDEMRYRRRGHFIAADNARRLGDYLESGGTRPSTYSYLDRGAIAPLDGYIIEGIAVVMLDNGTGYAFTPDRASELALAALGWVDPDFAEALWGGDQ